MRGEDHVVEGEQLVVVAAGLLVERVEGETAEPSRAEIRVMVVTSAMANDTAFGLAASNIVLIREHSDPMTAPFDPSRVQENFARLEAEVMRAMKRQ